MLQCTSVASASAPETNLLHLLDVRWRTWQEAQALEKKLQDAIKLYGGLEICAYITDGLLARSCSLKLLSNPQSIICNLW